MVKDILAYNHVNSSEYNTKAYLSNYLDSMNMMEEPIDNRGTFSFFEICSLRRDMLGNLRV